MRLDWYYIARHPMTDELHVAEIAMTWDEVGQDWKLPGWQESLPFMEPETEFFRTRNEALEALHRGEWKRETTADDDA